MSAGRGLTGSTWQTTHPSLCVTCRQAASWMWSLWGRPLFPELLRQESLPGLGSVD